MTRPSSHAGSRERRQAPEMNKGRSSPLKEQLWRSAAPAAQLSKRWAPLQKEQILRGAAHPGAARLRPPVQRPDGLGPRPHSESSHRGVRFSEADYWGAGPPANPIASGPEHSTGPSRQRYQASVDPAASIRRCYQESLSLFVSLFLSLSLSARVLPILVTTVLIISKPGRCNCRVGGPFSLLLSLSFSELQKNIAWKGSLSPTGPIFLKGWSY